MNAMFWGAENFNQDISGWNVSNVTDFDNMFTEATQFLQDLSRWDVTGKPHNGMFNGAVAMDIQYAGYLAYTANPSTAPYYKNYYPQGL